MENYTRRFLVSVFILIFFFAVLSIRIWYLQILKGDEFEKFARNNRIRSIRIVPPRGRILDRNGRGIVINRSSFDLYAVPSEIENKDKFLDFLSAVLLIEKQELEKRIYGSSDNKKFNQVLIERDITRDELAVLESRRDSYPWMFIEVSKIREYPHGKLGANFLGFVGKTTMKELQQHTDLTGFDLIGKSGLEKNYQDYLKGSPGYLQKVTDAFGREIKSSVYKTDINLKQSMPGADLILTIDSDFQVAVEQILSEYTGAAVVMNVKNGEMLAMASSPSFDPSIFVKGVKSDDWKELVSDTNYPLVNRATKGLYPPGSVYKIVTAAAALEENAVDHTTRFFCPGHYKLGKKIFRCWKSGGHGWVDIHKALVESCDVFFYEVSQIIGIDKIDKYSRQMGYGSYTGVDIGEKPGISPNKTWKKERLNRPWYKGDTVNVSIGQGFLSVTPLQVAVMTSTIANGGYRVTPHFVKEVVAGSGEKLYEYKDSREEIEVDDNFISIVSNAMAGVVNQNNGTARRARLRDIEVAGKTGTAQVVALDSSKIKDKKYDHHAWFTAFAPAKTPEIAVTVLLEHGGKGGAVASPVARQIIDTYFHLNFHGPRL
ncbi:MAG: penicillin-binding protein 2 [Candidatus Dadabacteria bacterium]|nr:penicillin-binding protein 2 [Candidatus Dadabacteria bacterium]NIS09091.1 penicillin-binding protein 2 [Candidatus Dadabacteria bacterium]NIV41526.1 penicillin-binding protein 2 [Candidatus Dadabacteria bacterium]NIX15207.1 penicillin-binding protein 2 [Candidatus Dadabacteria bacterium]NIY21852.1 penicillin-binding protein 2 [Candidatus Dadabacteria bacterium]